MIHLVAVGRLRSPPLAELCRDFTQRAARLGVPLRLEEVQEGRGGEIRSLAALVARLRSRGYVVALDERGVVYRSQAFARWLEGRMSAGDLTFVIGGAPGLPQEILEAADARLSLSAMTLPHELARLLLLEQLYRAASILRGHPYHRE